MERREKTHAARIVIVSVVVLLIGWYQSYQIQAQTEANAVEME